MSIPPQGVYWSGNRPGRYVIEGTLPGMTGPKRFLHARMSGRGYVILSDQNGDIGEFDCSLVEYVMDEIRKRHDD